MIDYRHTQTGHVILVAGGLALFLDISLGVSTSLTQSDWASFGITLAVGIFLAVALLSFSTLTVTVAQGVVEARFGPLGLFRKRLALRDIESCQVVRNPWWYGWGIRLTPRGWLFNVSGLDAVEFRMNSGRNYRIGTDEPQALQAAIRNTPRR